MILSHSYETQKSDKIGKLKTSSGCSSSILFTCFLSRMGTGAKICEKMLQESGDADWRGISSQPFSRENSGRHCSESFLNDSDFWNHIVNTMFIVRFALKAQTWRTRLTIVLHGDGRPICPLEDLHSVDRLIAISRVSQNGRRGRENGGKWPTEENT
jgi:hypothetical protein